MVVFSGEIKLCKLDIEIKGHSIIRVGNLYSRHGVMLCKTYRSLKIVLKWLSDLIK